MVFSQSIRKACDRCSKMYTYLKRAPQGAPPKYCGAICRKAAIAERERERVAFMKERGLCPTCGCSRAAVK